MFGGGDLWLFIGSRGAWLEVLMFFIMWTFITGVRRQGHHLPCLAHALLHTAACSCSFLERPLDFPLVSDIMAGLFARLARVLSRVPASA